MSIRTQLIIELLSIALLAAAYLLLLPVRPAYLDAALGVAAVILIALSSRRSRCIWRQQPAEPRGYRSRLRTAFGQVMLFTLPAALLFLAVGAALGYEQGGWPAVAARVLNWHLAPALAIYLVWGLVQQFVFQFYLFGRLLYLLPAPAAVALTAVAFSAVHYPRPLVMAAVAIAALVWTRLYLRFRTLLPLAVSHAILGSTLHYWVFARDLWALWF
jgi:membrane protease YdiL (CAAX protease family)